jgi:hypothetical protein
LDDVTIRGRVHAAQFPIRRANYRVNDADPVAFYVDPIADLQLLSGPGQWWPSPIDWRTGYKDSPAGLRLKRLGDFVLEIPIDHLVPGDNTVTVEVEDHGKDVDATSLAVTWNPAPVPLPLDLSDLNRYTDVQDVGQVVNGRWELDRPANLIRCHTPADPDSLLLLGSPAASQEATYRFVAHQPHKAKYIGLSDFFVRNETEDPPIGVKPGYSTAGLATVKFNHEARSWLSFGDNAHRSECWLAVTDPPATFAIDAERPYRVRHQLLIAAGVTTSRFRIWPEDAPEPGQWLCQESDAAVDPAKPRFTAASFGLFMHTGVGSEWSDIRLRTLTGQEDR